MDISDIKKHGVALKVFLDHELNQIARETQVESTRRGNTPQEPDYIAHLSIHLPIRLHEYLKNFFPSTAFSVTGVFCHQKPLADFGMPPVPELGDILFVYIYKDRSGKKRYNSLLLQAKMSSAPISMLAISDMQLKLYTEWPKFKYQRAGGLNGTDRDIMPKAVTDGAQYLLIDNNMSLFGRTHTSSMGCATAAQKLIMDRTLGEELIELLKFKSGRPFVELTATPADEWSQMIWDLLSITKSRVSRRVNSGLRHFPRQACYSYTPEDTITFSTDEGVDSIFGWDRDNSDSTSPPEDKTFNSEAGGIPTIIIEATEPESE